MRLNSSEIWAERFEFCGRLITNTTRYQLVPDTSADLVFSFTAKLKASQGE
jgi:hypothetical protein